MYGELSGSAARLLLVYRDKNGLRLKKETLMKRSGIGADRVFYSARKELELKGFIKLTRVSGLPSTVELFSIGMSDQRERLTTEEEIKIDIDTLFERYQHNINLTNILYYYINRGNSSNIHHPDDVCGDEKLCNLRPTGTQSYDLQVPTTQMGHDSQVLGHSTPDSYVPTGSDLQVPTPSTPEYPVLLGHDLQVSSKQASHHLTEIAKDVQRVWKAIFPYAPALGKVQRETLLGLCDNNLETFKDKLNYVGEQASKKDKQLENPYGYTKYIFQNAFNGSGVQGKQGLKDRGKYNETSGENTPIKPPTHSSVDNSHTVEYNTHTGIDELPEPSPELLAEADILKERFEQMKLERGWLE